MERTQLTEDLRLLADDAMAGRQPGTAGHRRARDYLVARFRALKLQPFGDAFVHGFSFAQSQQGENIIGLIPGARYADAYIVITAHYDHLGHKGRRIFNGADDNASGVAGLLALASHFRQSPPAHSMIFVATDAEEAGLHGAHAFFTQLPVKKQAIRLNINLDMIGHGGQRDELLLVHSGKHPALRQVLAQAKSTLSLTHLRLRLTSARSQLSQLTDTRRVSWRNASDYAVFGKHGIPFVHIGTSPHRDYHTTDDTLANIDTTFFVSAASAALCVVSALDAAIE